MAATDMQPALLRFGNMAGGGVHALCTMAADTGRLPFVVGEHLLQVLDGDLAPIRVHQFAHAPVTGKTVRQ